MWFLDTLHVIKKPEDEMLFITHQYTEDAKIATALWAKKYKLYYYGDVLFESGDEKWRHCNILIDDKIENLTQLQLNVPDSLPICCARAWNAGSIFRGNYTEILTHLQSKLG
jgi:hypothetical protein